MKGKRIFIRGAEIFPAEDDYHPFTAGLVIRNDKKGLCVAARGALLRLPGVKANLGDRFFTPSEKLDQAMAFSAVYDARGLKA